MRVLTVCSGNTSSDKPFDIERDRPFVAEQMAAVARLGVSHDLFLIQGRGVRGYLSNRTALLDQLKTSDYDVVHAHFGLSGFVGTLQRRVPTVITFHGCDVNVASNNVISTTASLRSEWSIFVSRELHETLFVSPRDRYSIIPCGVNLDVFRVLDMEEARRQLGLQPEGQYVLFASDFSVPVKNYPLAQAAMALLGGEVELIEMRGYSRSEVALLMNACDALLLTSIREGSPQVIKEAMACGCPIVTTRVGDVEHVIGDTEGCYVCPPDPVLLSQAVEEVLARDLRTAGRERVLHLSVEAAARQVVDIYQTVVG